MAPPITLVICVCEQCGKLHQKFASSALRAVRTFCSRQCQYAHRATHGTSVPSSEFLTDGIDDVGIEWRTIPSFPSYQASSLGAIRRSRSGASNACKLGKHLSLKISSKGYRLATVVLGGKPHTTGVHRLICEAFHGVSDGFRTQTAHGDGNPSNNTPSNLRWATPAENSADAIKHGTMPRGEKAGVAKFTDADIRIIRSRYPSISQELLAVEFQTSQSHIGRIVRRQVWAHVE